MSRLIALLTDFGTTDIYVGVMKGVMLGIFPELQFVDLTHAIQPQNVRQAAFLLLNSYRFFPAGTIFLVVIDPGVGSTRKPIAVRAGDYTFVAPDNGVLSYALNDFDIVKRVELNNPAYRLSGLSNTFHGRDVFAPTAAHLAAGVKLEQMGNIEFLPVRLPKPLLLIESKHITGEVLHIDHFGNVITSIGLLDWDWVLPEQLRLTPRFGSTPPLSFAADKAVITIGSQHINGIHRTYAEVGQGEVLALVGSSGYLEIAVNSASFRSLNVAQLGDTVEVQIG